VSDLGKPIEPRGDELPTQRGYSRMVLNIALSISLVSVIPLVVLTWFNYNQYRLTLDSRSIRPMERMTEAARRSVHRVVAAHRGAMETATRECRREATPEIEQHLQTVCTSLNEAFGDFRVGQFLGDDLLAEFAEVDTAAVVRNGDRKHATAD